MTAKGTVLVILNDLLAKFPPPRGFIEEAAYNEGKRRMLMAVNAMTEKEALELLEMAKRRIQNG